jgi:solute carrier family 25 thiamine pyrophosphate transporter 19
VRATHSSQWCLRWYSLQFASFEVLTQQAWYLLPRFREDAYRPVVHFVCGGAAGTLATMLSFPSDVVRTRLVAQGEPKVGDIPYDRESVGNGRTVETSQWIVRILW